MNTNYTDITVLLDGSGSMAGLWTQTIAGVNTFISEQKVAPPAVNPQVGNITFDLNESQPVRCRLTLIVFSSGRYQKIIDAQDVDTIQPIDPTSIHATGGTPLWESMCRCIDETGNRYSDMKEEDRPGRVIFMTVTDGEETQYTPPQSEVKRRVDTQTNQFNWQFMYQGANQNAILVAKEMGISANNSMCYAASAGGTLDSFRSSSRTVLRKRSVEPEMMCSTGYMLADYASADSHLQSMGAMTNAAALGQAPIQLTAEQIQALGVLTPEEQAQVTKDLQNANP